MCLFISETVVSETVVSDAKIHFFRFVAFFSSWFSFRSRNYATGFYVTAGFRSHVIPTGGCALAWDL